MEEDGDNDEIDVVDDGDKSEEATEDAAAADIVPANGLPEDVTEAATEEWADRVASSNLLDSVRVLMGDSGTFFTGAGS